ncbi:MAG: hypothetical protein KME31_20845 [Tolypothrix carrinoi HA7290-LM1]|nr:hypothetical protein [Tolypothrix carrinoi HA7290-LM1]
MPITHSPLRGSEVAHGGDHGRCVTVGVRPWRCRRLAAQRTASPWR